MDRRELQAISVIIAVQEDRNLFRGIAVVDKQGLSAIFVTTAERKEVITDE